MPRKKRHRFPKKITSGILFLILITAGLIAAIFLSQQPQEIRRRAAGGICTTPPSIPTNLKARGGENPGEIRISWRASTDVEYYGIAYGNQPGNYTSNIPNIGNVREFIIKNLTPSATYYLTSQAINSCGSSPFSQEISAIATAQDSSTSTIITTPSPTLTPSPVNTPKPLYEHLNKPLENKTEINGIPLIVPILTAAVIVGISLFYWSKKRRRRTQTPRNFSHLISKPTPPTKK